MFELSIIGTYALKDYSRKDRVCFPDRIEVVITDSQVKMHILQNDRPIESNMFDNYDMQYKLCITNDEINIEFYAPDGINYAKYKKID